MITEILSFLEILSEYFCSVRKTATQFFLIFSKICMKIDKNNYIAGICWAIEANCRLFLQLLTLHSFFLTLITVFLYVIIPYIHICFYYFLILCFYFHLRFLALLNTKQIPQFTILFNFIQFYCKLLVALQR